MRTDSDPGAQLGEATQATLFVHHPYGKPVIGWQHEIESFDRNDALAYYARFYTPENAILIVAGDVEAEAVKNLAEATYGKVPARGEAPRRVRPKEPPLRAQRLVTLADAKVRQPNLRRLYRVPSYTSGEAKTAAALEVLAHVLGVGQTSRLYMALVREQKIAVSVGAHYLGHSLDDTRFVAYAIPAEGVTLERLDAAIEEVVRAIARDGVCAEDLARSKSRLVADAVYAQDNQTALAQWYGTALATGLTVEDVAAWPDRIEAVSDNDLREAAEAYLVKNCCVSGHLLPSAAA